MLKEEVESFDIFVKLTEAAWEFLKLAIYQEPRSIIHSGYMAPNRRFRV